MHPSRVLLILFLSVPCVSYAQDENTTNPANAAASDVVQPLDKDAQSGADVADDAQSGADVADDAQSGADVADDAQSSDTSDTLSR